MKLPSKLALTNLPVNEESIRLLEKLHDTMLAQQEHATQAQAQVREPIEFVLVEPKRAA